jgi:hypothetical protein
MRPSPSHLGPRSFSLFLPVASHNNHLLPLSFSFSFFFSFFFFFFFFFFFLSFLSSSAKISVLRRNGQQQLRTPRPPSNHVRPSERKREKKEKFALTSNPGLRSDREGYGGGG